MSDEDLVRDNEGLSDTAIKQISEQINGDLQAIVSEALTPLKLGLKQHERLRNYRENARQAMIVLLQRTLNVKHLRALEDEPTDEESDRAYQAALEAVDELATHAHHIARAMSVEEAISLPQLDKQIRRVKGLDA